MIEIQFKLFDHFQHFSVLISYFFRIDLLMLIGDITVDDLFKD